MITVKVSLHRNHCSLWYPFMRVSHTCFDTGIARALRVNGVVRLQPVMVAGLDWFPRDFFPRAKKEFGRFISWPAVLADKIGFLIKAGKLVSNSGCHRTELHFVSSEGLRATLWRVKHEIEAPRLDREALIDFTSRYFYGSSRIVSYVSAGPDSVSILEEAGVAEEAAKIWFDERLVEQTERDEIISLGKFRFVCVEPEIDDEEFQYYGPVSRHSFFGIEMMAAPWFRWTSEGRHFVLARLPENTTVTAPDGETAYIAGGWWLVHRSC